MSEACSHGCVLVVWSYGRIMVALEPLPYLYRLQLGIANAYLWTGDGGVTRVDTGPAGSAPLIRAALDELGLRPEDLRRIVLTHFHDDHAGSAAEVASWGGAPIAAGIADAAIIRGMEVGPAPNFTDTERALHALVAGDLPPAPPACVDQEVDEGDVLDFAGGAAVLSVPGHTAGSIALHAPGHGFLITGDIIGEHEGSIVLGPFNTDRPLAWTSLQRLVSLDLEGLRLRAWHAVRRGGVDRAPGRKRPTGLTAFSRLGAAPSRSSRAPYRPPDRPASERALLPLHDLQSGRRDGSTRGTLRLRPSRRGCGSATGPTRRPRVAAGRAAPQVLTAARSPRDFTGSGSACRSGAMPFDVWVSAPGTAFPGGHGTPRGKNHRQRTRLCADQAARRATCEGFTMRKLVSGLSMSLDGVVEAPETWHLPYLSDQLRAALGAYLASADTLLMGRNTYEAFAGYWATQGSDVPFADHINNTPKFVVSSTMTPPTWQNTTQVKDEVLAKVAELKSAPGKDISVAGSPTLVRALLKAGLLDEVWLTIHPVVVGPGIRLFDESAGRLALALVHSEAYDNGVLSVTYRPEAG